MNKSRDMKVFTMGLAPLRSYWYLWRRVYANNLKLNEALTIRQQRNRRICYDRLVQNVWQSVKFRELQQNYQRRVIVICFGAWAEYRRWCKQFQSIYSRSILHVKRMHMIAFKRFANDCNEVRLFRKKVKTRAYSLCFSALKRNTVLTKYELKKRLQYGKMSLFYDKLLCQRILSRWQKRNHLVVKIDELEEFLELIHLKQGLIKWYISTFGPRSERRARSIAKAKGYITSLRTSFESSAKSTWKYISDGISAMSPLVDRKALETAQYETGENRRRLRMQQALEYANREYGDSD